MYDELTKVDIEKLQAEIDERRLKLQPELIAAVQEARAQGDLSENFEYYAAKREKRQNESRIRYLENMIKTAVIIEDHSKADEVGLNKRVEVYFPDDDETEVFRIVTSIRGNSMKNLVSIDSPIGRALLHKKAGDTATVRMENGASYQVVIRSIGEDEGEEGDAIRGF